MKIPHHMSLEENATPTIHPPRKAPFGFRDKIKEELDRLVDQNIIEKVDYRTEWVNSLVIVDKPNGKLRLCLDPKELNAAIKREYHHILTLEEITAELSDAKYLSILDADSGFRQMPLDI